MTVAVRFDEKVWGHLASMAENQRTTIPDLIERAVERLVVGTTRSNRAQDEEARQVELARTRSAHRDGLVAEFARLRTDGHTIQAIAKITGYSKTYVSRVLIENGHRTRTRSDAPEASERNAT